MGGLLHLVQREGPEQATIWNCLSEALRTLASDGHWPARRRTEHEAACQQCG